ncbi:hypothetical protein IV203_011681 [Nitzschia inconspicua]|uniref:Ricin B lectin domain-containing protein n=1 Tax=Nitzschia inconspicua TaxID=303405 RepID=A0A9K3KS93_9STRA|nr:hypothetical protein IV203_011681 [Nitzschia inconspicua]
MKNCAIHTLLASLSLAVPLVKCELVENVAEYQKIQKLAAKDTLYNDNPQTNLRIQSFPVGISVQRNHSRNLAKSGKQDKSSSTSTSTSTGKGSKSSKKETETSVVVYGEKEDIEVKEAVPASDSEQMKDDSAQKDEKDIEVERIPISIDADVETKTEQPASTPSPTRRPATPPTYPSTMVPAVARADSSSEISTTSSTLSPTLSPVMFVHQKTIQMIHLDAPDECLAYDETKSESSVQMIGCSNTVNGTELDHWQIIMVDTNRFLLRHTVSDLCLPKNPEHPDQLFDCFRYSGDSVAIADSINGLVDCHTEFAATMEWNSISSSLHLYNADCMSQTESHEAGTNVIFMSYKRGHGSNQTQIVMWGEQILMSMPDLVQQHSFQASWIMVEVY